MIIDFTKLEKEEKVNFRDGEGSTFFYAYRDETNKIFKIVLNPGCSIGIHKHEGNQEIMYLLEGKVEVIDDNEKIILTEGQVNYCKNFHSHGISNIGDKPAILICSVTVIQ